MSLVPPAGRDAPGTTDASGGPLWALVRDAAGLDAVADGRPVAASGGDVALGLLAALRAEVDLRVTAVTDPTVTRDALLLDAVAAGHMVVPAVDRAAALLAALREAADGASMTVAHGREVPPVAPVAPVAPVLPRQRIPTRRGQRRAARAAVLAVGLAGAMSTSGVAAAAWSAHPGASLYGLRAAVFGRTDDDPQLARDLLAQAQREYDLAETRPGQAEQHLAVGSALVARAQRLLPKVRDPQAPLLAADATVLQVRLEQAPRVRAAPRTVLAAPRGPAGPSPAGAVRVAVPTSGPPGPGPRSAPAAASAAGAAGSPQTTAGSPVATTPAPTVTPSATGPTVTPAPAGATESPAPSVAPTPAPTPAATGTPGGAATATPSPGPPTSPAASAVAPAPPRRPTTPPTRPATATRRPTHRATATPTISTGATSGRRYLLPQLDGG